MFQGFLCIYLRRFNIGIQIIMTDNGIEYVKHEFGNFLLEKGIPHQTSCPDTFSIGWNS
jgi:hypothetical protein